MGILSSISSDDNCGCGQSTVQEEILTNRCPPYNYAHPASFAKLSQVFWDGDDYPTLGITKGMRMSDLMLNILNRLLTIENNLE